MSEVEKIVGELERAARAHYDALHAAWATPAGGLSRWGTWDEACQMDGWRDKHLAAMRAALDALKSSPALSEGEGDRISLADYRKALDAMNEECERAERLQDELEQLCSPPPPDKDGQSLTVEEVIDLIREHVAVDHSWVVARISERSLPKAAQSILSRLRSGGPIQQGEG